MLRESERNREVAVDKLDADSCGKTVSCLPSPSRFIPVTGPPPLCMAAASTTTRESARRAARRRASTWFRWPGAGCSSSRAARCRNGSGSTSAPAQARELACLIYTLVTRGEEYVERGIETYERRRVDRSVSNLGRRAKQLGYQLVRMPEDPDSESGAESMASSREVLLKRDRRRYSAGMSHAPRCPSVPARTLVRIPKTRIRKRAGGQMA